MRLCELKELVSFISYPGLTFEADGDYLGEDGQGSIMWLQVVCEEGTCNVTGLPMSWRGRRWIIEEDATEGEVVRTALKAVLTAIEHEARENFAVNGEAIFDPHKAGAA